MGALDRRQAWQCSQQARAVRGRQGTEPGSQTRVRLPGYRYPRGLRQPRLGVWPVGGPGSGRRGAPGEKTGAGKAVPVAAGVQT